MLKRKNIINGTKTPVSKGDINNDILTYNKTHGIDFSDLDLESKDKLIKEVCNRILRLEQDGKK